jgi:Na+/H+ antiporter NhaD/arsenite permease-like protein
MSAVFIIMAILFILGYTVIALEHPLKVDKAATALFLGTTLWAIYALDAQDVLSLNFSRAWKEYIETHPDIIINAETIKEFVTHHEVLEHLAEIATILFFLLGAMTIVEIVDQHEGFKIITDKIKTTSKIKLLWVVSFLTFFMSAVLDNLTTTIVIIALLRKLIDDKQTRWFFASMVVLAANAGGAWSPIGDVTTIMLWIGGQVTTLNIIAKLIIPSLITMIIPLIILSFTMKGEVKRPEAKKEGEDYLTKNQQLLMLILGVSALLFVPVFKTYTHLPPYLGMLFGLSILWITTEVMHKKRKEEDNFKLTVNKILQKVDVPTIFFFLGILSAVSALQSAGHLDLLAKTLKDHHLGVYSVSIILGLLSSVVDNVPLVAAAMGMYPIDPFHAQFMTDGVFWELIAYTAGTGGSILIIGSAAGVAAMGLEKIDFIWYFKKISIWALLGYFAGAGAYWVQEQILPDSLEEVKISKDKLPQKSIEYINKKYNGATIEDVELFLKHKNDTIGYKVDINKDGKTLELHFTTLGKFEGIAEE